MTGPMQAEVASTSTRLLAGDIGIRSLRSLSLASTLPSEASGSVLCISPLGPAFTSSGIRSAERLRNWFSRALHG